MDNHTVVQLQSIAKDRGTRGYYKLRKAELIRALEAARLVEQKIASLISRAQMIPLQFYNQYLGGHQISRRKVSKIKKNSLQKACKRLKICVNGCSITYHQNQSGSYIPLPAFLAANKAIISLRNEDDDCFKCAITRELNPVEKHPEYIDKEFRETSKVLNWTAISSQFE